MTKEKTFKEYLSALPKQQLIALVQEGEGANKIVSVTQAVNQLFVKLTDETYLSTLYDSLDTESREVLRYLLFQGSIGADAVEISRFTAHCTDEEKFQLCVQQLQKILLVYGVRSAPYRYFVFKEIREIMVPLLINRWLAVFVPPGISEPLLAENGDPYSLFRDFIIFLLKLASEPIRKTKGSTLNRKQMEHWTPLFTHKFDFSTAEKGTYPKAFSLLLEVSSKQGLLYEDEKEIKLSDDGEQFLDLDDAVKARIFYSTLIDGNQKEKTDIFLKILLLASGKPVMKEELHKFLLMNEKNGNLSDLEDRLIALNLIQIKDVSSGKYGYLITSVGVEVLERKVFRIETANTITIMPTFEIMAPRFLSSKILKPLFLCCEAVKSDAFITFKISRESLFAGYEKGVAPKALVALLENSSHGVLPQNVRFSIEEWSDSWGALSFEMHFILRVKKPELYERVKGVVSGSSFVKEEFNGTGFSINASDYKALYEILEKLGYNPKPYSSLPMGECAQIRTSNYFQNNIVKKSFFETERTEFLLPEEFGKVKVMNGSLGRKYSGRMMRLPFNELVHVINYSMLMEQGIEVELTEGGNSYFQPKELLLHLSQPKVTGNNPHSGENVDIELAKIDRIRVKE
jgi:hypothetical protein